MENRNEQLLNAWLRLSVGIDNEKLVSDMSFNESLICNILYWNMRKHPDRELTATDLCRSTRMLKSQMNRTLNSMEEKHVITRERSKTDKRNVYVRLDLSKISIYHDQHRKVLEIVDSIIEKLGTETADEAIRIFNLIADTAMEVIE